MSMLHHRPEPLEEHIAEFLAAQRKPGPIELSEERLRDRHFSLFTIREP